MATLDYEKMKKEAAKLQARMNRGGSAKSMKFWKPAEGKNTIRILPPWTNEGTHAGSFYREVHQHWNVNQNSPGPVLCPKNTPGLEGSHSCPICDFVDQLRADKSNVAAQQLAKDLRSKAAYLLSIVDINDPTYTAKDVAEWKKERPDQEPEFSVGDVKIQCYAASNTIAEQILQTVLQNEMDITDPEHGNNVFITKVGNADKMKTRYTVSPELRQTKLVLPEGIELPDLSRVGSVKNEQDMLKLLEEGAGADFLSASNMLPASTEETTGFNDSAELSTSSGEDLAASMKSKLKTKK